MASVGSARSPVRSLSLLVLVLLASPSCGSRGVTEGKIERAVATTFANLVSVQEASLELPAVEASSLRASARCQRVDGRGGDGGATGSGDWTCVITWFVPGRRVPIHETYDVAVTVEGCYTATSEGPEAHAGGARLPTKHGVVENLLYVFEGCFDTT